MEEFAPEHRCLDVADPQEYQQSLPASLERASLTASTFFDDDADAVSADAAADAAADADAAEPLDLNPRIHTGAHEMKDTGRIAPHQQLDGTARALQAQMLREERRRGRALSASEALTAHEVKGVVSWDLPPPKNAHREARARIRSEQRSPNLRRIESGRQFGGSPQAPVLADADFGDSQRSVSFADEPGQGDLGDSDSDEGREEQAEGWERGAAGGGGGGWWCCRKRPQTREWDADVTTASGNFELDLSSDSSSDDDDDDGGGGGEGGGAGEGEAGRFLEPTLRKQAPTTQQQQQQPASPESPDNPQTPGAAASGRGYVPDSSPEESSGDDATPVQPTDAPSRRLPTQEVAPGGQADGREKETEGVAAAVHYASGSGTCGMGPPNLQPGGRLVHNNPSHCC